MFKLGWPIFYRIIQFHIVSSILFKVYNAFLFTFHINRLLAIVIENHG